ERCGTVSRRGIADLVRGSCKTPWEVGEGEARQLGDADGYTRQRGIEQRSLHTSVGHVERNGVRVWLAYAARLEVRSTKTTGRRQGCQAIHRSALRLCQPSEEKR